MAALIRIVTVALAATLFVGDVALAAEPKSLGRFRDWESFSASEQGQKICYALTSPKTSKGQYKSRDPVFIMITRRPAERVFDEVSAIAGYTYQSNSKPVISVGKRKFPADAVQDVAWPKLKDGRNLVSAMRGGSSLELAGTSSRGTNTQDSFSLLGFTAALKAIQRSCPKR
jgi:hypothetical protein